MFKVGDLVVFDCYATLWLAHRSTEEPLKTLVNKLATLDWGNYRHGDGVVLLEWMGALESPGRHNVKALHPEHGVVVSLNVTLRHYPTTMESASQKA